MTKPIPRRSQRSTLPFAARRWLLSGEKSFWYFIVRDQAPEDIWEQHGPAVTEYYARKYAGLRPFLWWFFDAPEPRRRLGGVGKLLQETCPAIQLRYHFGIPSDWGQLSESDPPTFESEAAYLKRLGRLLSGEEARLGPANFEPRVVLRVPSLSPLATAAASHPLSDHRTTLIWVQKQSSPRPRPRPSSLDELIAEHTR